MMQTIKRKLVLLIIMFSTLHAYSQRLQVDDRSAKNEESRDVDSWTAHLDQDVSYCMSTYADFIKKTFNTKTSHQQKNMLIVEKFSFPEISNLRIDLRAVFNSESAGTAVACMFSPGYDIHFGHNLYKDEFARGEMFVKNYVRFHYEFFYNEQIKKLQDKNKDKLDDIESNEKKIEKNKKSISDNDKKIADGDESAAKLKERSAKMDKENQTMTDENAKLREEITKLQDEIITQQSCLKRAKDFN